MTMEENENLQQDLEKNPDEKENKIIRKAKDVKSSIKSKFSPSKKMKDSENASSDEEEQPEKKLKDKRKKLDIELENAVNSYNSTYALLQDHGIKLLCQRQRSIDLLDNVENLINSIANHPKEFDADIKEIQVNKNEFKSVCDFAKEELDAATKSAMSASAGVAGGAAVAALTPSAAMWVATTFGTASTGTAISTLSGAAAKTAALAWLGGGALSAGGGGVAAGNALLALAGPIGWGIAGATLLTSICLYTRKRIKINKEKRKVIESTIQNEEKLQETDTKLYALLVETYNLREKLNKQYTSALNYYNNNFLDINEEGQMLLGTIVNNSKSLALSLKRGVE